MRVAFVTNIIPPYRKTFYEKLCRTPGVEWLIVRGVSTVEDGRPDYRDAIDIPEVRVENTEVRFGPYTLRWQSGAFGAVTKFRPNVLVTLGISGTLSNWLLCLWARLRGVKVVLWACGWEPQRRGSLTRRAKQLLARLFFAMADRCLLYSTKGADYLSHLGVPRAKIKVCFNGIEIDHLLANESRIMEEAQRLRERESLGAKSVLLYVGGMLEEKRVDMLIEAYAQLRKEHDDWVLWLVGDGPARPALEMYVQAQRLEGVKFWGRIVEGVDIYFAAADVFVLPGVGGLAFNQAMFWRKPCVGGAADGTEDDLVIDGVTGKRFVPDNIESLIEVVRECVETPHDIRQTWGERARRIVVEQSNVSNMVQVFTSLIRDVGGQR